MQNKDISRLIKHRQTPHKTLKKSRYILESINPKGYKTFCFLKICFIQVISIPNTRPQNYRAFILLFLIQDVFCRMYKIPFPHDLFFQNENYG